MKKLTIFLLLLICSTTVYALSTGISIANWQYEPVNITIGSGMTVIWANNEVGSTHRVIIRGIGVSSSLLFPGDLFNYTFDEPGTYQFYDSASPARLKGNIVVIPMEEYTYCGDGICNEDKTVCCKDCGCEINYYCFNNVCVENLTKTTVIEEEPIEETKPTNYIILIFGSITIIALFFIVIILKAIAKSKKRK